MIDANSLLRLIRRSLRPTRLVWFLLTLLFGALVVDRLSDTIRDRAFDLYDRATCGGGQAMDRADASVQTAIEKSREARELLEPARLSRLSRAELDRDRQRAAALVQEVGNLERDARADLRVAIECGRAEAHSVLATMLCQGRGGPRDLTEALRIIRTVENRAELRGEAPPNWVIEVRGRCGLTLPRAG